MERDEQPTCGKGLAAGAALPARLAQLLAARAEVLQRHTRALDAADSAARPELDAYTSLAQAHRDVAAALDRLAGQMAACRDLPMAPHDMSVMADPNGQAAAFRQFVDAERDLAEFLNANLAELAEGQ